MQKAAQNAMKKINKRIAEKTMKRICDADELFGWE